MKKYLNIIRISVTGCVFAFGLLFLLNSCDTETIEWTPESDKMVITDILIAEENAEKYSLFAELVDTTDLDALLRVRGPFTLFVPTNDAVKKYCADNGITSLLDLSPEVQKNLVLNHLILTSVQTGDVGLGAIREVNGLGDKLVTEFRGSDIVINKTARLIKRDIQAANGYVQEIDYVLDPITIKLFDLIESNPAYSLFSKGLELTGLKDTLLVVDVKYGQKRARTNFTVLAVPDSIFNREGIFSIDDMISKFTDDPNNLKQIGNGFYRYMEYHCLGGTYYLSDLESKLYPILSNDNNIAATITDDYKLNYNRKDSSYVGFIIEQSNVPAKNGALHAINGLLPVVEPEPRTMEFETTDYFDIKNGDYYKKYYRKWYDGENQFEYIKWKGDYLQYYYKDHDAPTQVNMDCLNLLGFWELELTTPKIMKGKYELSGYLWGPDRLVYEVYVDGVYMTTIARSGDVQGSDRPKLGIVDWDKTERHKIRLVALTFGTMFWDVYTLTPVQ